MADVLVVAELAGGQIRKATHSAITFAREAAGHLGGGFSILVIGQGAAAAAAQLTDFGATKVYTTEITSVNGYVCEHYAPTVAELAKQFAVVVATATAYGKDLIPRVAAKLGAGYAADISGVSHENGLMYKRPIYAGNAFGYVQISTPIQAVTVRQSEFTAAQPAGGASPVENVAAVAPSAGADRVEFISFDQVKSERPELTEASVVVSGGRACKEKFFEVLNPLADLFGAAIGATRAACDAGYAPGDLQVGQTGKIVAPDLYFAFGLSGAIQHLAGMKGSKVIVAVNKDPEAPIFSVADYGLVADLFQVIPELVQQIKAVKE
ncbi:MAG TPA: electron transfer flavoprotein subunit alpha/FixB family protein [Polyangiaceae bacterium]|jgi:electron transfer flavoprotein alpha subunit|nr:MAG: Electron transfer flavoprotein subunit alpha [Deltaproteobacteria bacterium ADurb.Bin207]HNZ23384.1 electron transfer flavoprotein subunit alpha/FixB family protein [Polyangiaceae bacterium]HOD22805.1 electron transfer flavoprotein subunit alpha/FixB family protein [Polyangiaceae bacterium]HOE49856.1 electron transfer flavoprotein subunit alpha/FixB family protein [Polyangiaceae bacterium]HOH01638.1 electron transfer flavoprotein subunit alpha/FixB family protein [Polyangiaceae bacteriu